MRDPAHSHYYQVVVVLSQALEISVVIPTRNRRDQLERTVRSALDQKGVDLEVIIVDDGSTDGTAAMARSLDERRVRVVTHPRPLGVAAARNRGIEEARAVWVALLDDDDLWAPDKLRIQLTVARETGAEFVYCAAAHVDDELRVIMIELAPAPDIIALLMLSNNVMPAGASNVIVRRTVLDGLGGFDRHFQHLADWDMWVRLTQRHLGAACDDVLVAYVKHAGNMVGLRESDVFDELDRLSAKHRTVCEAYGRDFERVDVARWVAETHRRAGRRLRAAAAYWRAVQSGHRGSLGSIARTLVESAAHRRAAVSRGGADPPWLESVREASGVRP